MRKKSESGIRQIAELAGVDVSTVSRALNRRAHVQPETAAQLAWFARECGFRGASAIPPQAPEPVSEQLAGLGIFFRDQDPETGETLGNVCDFVLDGYTVAALRLADGKEIEAARIASVKDALIADLRSPLPLKPARPARSKAKPAPNPPKAVQAAPAQPAPKAGSALLTGRRAPADVTDARGNVIVEKDTVITAEVLRRAMAHNKLFELTLSVLSVQ